MSDITNFMSKIYFYIYLDLVVLAFDKVVIIILGPHEGPAREFLII